jgi:tripartite-type tricarboxylate transporter receptor subunit TctC
MMPFPDFPSLSAKPNLDGGHCENRYHDKKLGRTMRDRLAIRPWPTCTLVQVAAAAILTFAAVASPASAQNYPSKPIRIMVGASAGGLVDIIARTFAQKLQDRSGQSVVVENRTGATGTHSADAVAKAPPDGTTLLLGYPAIMVVLPILNPNIPYDAAKDFAPVVHFGTAANVLVVNKDVPAHSVQELIALAKAKPGTLTYASQGIGSSAHMAAEQFRLAAGIDIVHVPYRGSAPAVTDLIAGQVNMMFDNVTFTMPQVKAGKVRALGITADKRVGVLPDVPTMAEAGLPDVQGGVWFTLFAPTGTPPEIVGYLNKQAREIFSAPDVRERFESQGLVLPLGPPEQLGAFVAEERKRWGDVIRRAGIQFPR